MEQNLSSLIKQDIQMRIILTSKTGRMLLEY
jgi:hypothetical protein